MGRGYRTFEVYSKPILILRIVSTLMLTLFIVLVIPYILDLHHYVVVKVLQKAGIIHNVFQELEFEQSWCPEFKSGLPAAKRCLPKGRLDEVGFKGRDTGEAKSQHLKHVVYTSDELGSSIENYLGYTINAFKIPKENSCSGMLSFVVLLSVSYLAWFIKTNVITGFKIWLAAASWVLLLSCIFCIIFPHVLVETLEGYSTFFIKCQIILWLMIPSFIFLTLSIIPIRFFYFVLIMLSSIIFTVAFACLRYVSTVMLLIYGKDIFLPLAFFFFGPLMDVQLIITVISFNLSRSKSIFN